MNNPDELSRPVATAATLGAVAPDASGFFKKPVLLTGERETLSTTNGLDCFQSALLLLQRMTIDLVVDISNHPDGDEVLRIVKEFKIHKVEVVRETPRYDAFSAILNVGTKTDTANPIVAISSNGWLFRVTSGGVPTGSDCAQSNPVGALAAASMGVSEIFKLLVGLKPGRGEPLRGYSYSLWDYNLSDKPGPEIADQISLPQTILFGGGAIGNGIVHLLQKLSNSGNLTIVDRDIFKKENLGTCLILKPADVGKPKADVLSKEIVFATPFNGDIEKFKSQYLGPAVQICLNGLDNIEARRQVQQFWPDLALDGAIGVFSCEATIHPWGPDLSCLMCDFEEPNVSAEMEASSVTGLTKERIENPTAIVSNIDVEQAPPDKKEWLRARIGQEICSVVSEAELAKIAKEKLEGRFEPSVPFVACLSAAMTVTELVRYLRNDVPAVNTGFQFDVLVGPHNGIKKDHSRKPSCLCVTRKSIIEKLRASHKAHG